MLTIALVIFFMVCLLHRLTNPPQAAVGADAIICDIGLVFLIFFGYIISILILPKIFEKVLFFFQTAQHLKNHGNFFHINFLSHAVILAIITKILYKNNLLGIFSKNFCFIKSLCHHEQNDHEWKFQFILDAIYSFGVVFPITVIGSIVWIKMLHFSNAQSLDIVLDEQDIVKKFSQIIHLSEVVTFGISACVIAPILEELIFRNLLYRFLKSRTHLTVAGIVTSLIFAGLHHNIMAFGSLFILSLGLTKVYEQTGDLRQAILVHSMFNIFNITVFMIL